jgi:hypothetical protein
MLFTALLRIAEIKAGVRRASFGAIWLDTVLRDFRRILRKSYGTSRPLHEDARGGPGDNHPGCRMRVRITDSCMPPTVSTLDEKKADYPSSVEHSSQRLALLTRGLRVVGYGRAQRAFRRYLAIPCGSGVRARLDTNDPAKRRIGRIATAKPLLQTTLKLCTVNSTQLSKISICTIRRFDR